MMMVMNALLSAALLLLLPPGTLTQFSIEVEVRNSLVGATPSTYRTGTAHRGILLGALMTLADSNTDFKFTYIQNPTYGPYLESVNGLAGSDKDHTYWELLVQTANGQTVRPDVGIGCYIPSKDEKIILNFTRW